ncbi:MAG: sugar transferase [Lachnospiraceae bacterium]|nr:sugar transferase [Lachnospiraceae bacterium]
MNRSNVGANTNVFQIVLDASLLVAAYLLSVLIFGHSLDGAGLGMYAVLAGVFTLIYLLANKEAYMYNVTMFYYLDRVFRKVTKSYLIALVSTTAILFFVTEDSSGRLLYLFFITLTYVVIVVKAMIYKPLSKKLSHKYAPRTVFVGQVDQYDKFRYFLEKTSIQMNPVGYIAVDATGTDDEANYIGKLEDLEEIIREYNVDQVYIIQREGEQLKFTQKNIDLCVTMGVTVRIVIGLYKRRGASSYVSTVGTYPIITYHTISLNVAEQMVKRITDIIGGLVGVILFSPIMLVTAIAIKLDSKGPVLFKQVRIGQNGRKFVIYKFRSMRVDAESRKKELMAKNEIQGGVMFKMKDDPRITKVGKVIRKLSIDELPQFFNVIQGTMSLVGTRPPTPDEVEKYKRDQWRRISIKPGITGMWQVNGRSNIDNFDDIVSLDVEYIDNWSLWLDIKIMIKTVLVLINHKDAY